MSVSTILLFAFIAILAIKGLIGDSRPSYYPPVQYGVNRPTDSFSWLAAIMVIIICLWLLVQFEVVKILE